MKNQLLFISLSLLIFFSCQDSSPLILDGMPKKDAQHLGEGVWIQVPPGYKSAKSYDGFQVSNNASSISLQVNYADLDQVRSSFDKKRLAGKRTKLIVMRPALVGQDSAIYTEVLDKRKQTKRYTLSIAKGDQIYSVKAFAFETEVPKYEQKIKDAFNSVYFGEVEEEKLLYSLASTENDHIYIMTKDGKWPNEEANAPFIETTILEEEINGLESGALMDFLAEKMEAKSDKRAGRMQSEFLNNGRFTTGSIEAGLPKICGALLTSNEVNVLIIGQSYNQEDFLEMEEFIRFSLIKTTIGSR